MSEGRVYAGEAPQDRTARRRRQVLDAGLALFGAQGYRRTTVRQLCSAARVTPRKFYEEFATLEQVLLAVYHEAMDRLERVVITETPDASRLDELVDSGLRAYFSELATDRELARVVWFEVLGVSDAVEEAYLQRTEGFVDLFDGLLTTLGLSSPLPPAQRRIFVRALVGGLSEVTRRWIKEDFATAQDDLVASMRLLLLTNAALLERGT